MSYPTPPTTDNHGLPLVPPIGSNNASDYEDVWGDIHNDMGWSYIEQRLIVVDADSNLSNYTPHDGAIFWSNTGNNNIYRGDGSNWNLISMGVDTTTADTTRTTRKDVTERGLSGTESLTINSGESMVVSGEYTVSDSAEVSVDGTGEFTVL